MILMKQTKQKRKSTKQAKKGWNVLLNQFGKNKDKKHCQTPFIFTTALFQKKIPFTKITFFKMSVKRNPEQPLFCFTSLCHWSRRLAPISQPIRCKTKTNHDLVARVFPRFGRFGCLYLILKVFLTFLLICPCDYFGFGSETLSGRAF